MRKVNCRSNKHRAVDCQDNQKCLLCKCKHHTSVYETRSDETSELVLASAESSVIYPVVIIIVNSIKCRALLETGSGSFYASEAIIDLLKINPIRKEYRTIETINSTTKKLTFHSPKIQDLKTGLPSPLI